MILMKSEEALLSTNKMLPTYQCTQENKQHDYSLNLTFTKIVRPITITGQAAY